MSTTQCLNRFAGCCDGDLLQRLEAALSDAASLEWEFMMAEREAERRLGRVKSPGGYMYHRERWLDLCAGADYARRMAAVTS